MNKRMVIIPVLLAAAGAAAYCVYRKPKSGRSGDEIRQGLRVP